MYHPRMRSLSALLAAALALAGSLFATDFPTVKAPLPALTVAQGGAIPATDLRNYFEVTSILGQVVQFRTTQGTYNVEMLPAAAPASVANFLVYVNGGRYANTFIHRSDLGLGVIQGGGYSLSNFNHIATDPPVVLEYNLPNTRGTISMARTAVLNSGTSEWFINTEDNTIDLGQANGGGYAVFGRVTGTGMTVVDAIHALPVYAFNSPFGQLPLSGYSGPGQPANSSFVAIIAAEAVPIFPASAGQNSVVSFSVANSNPALVTATVSGSALNLVPAPGQVGVADLTVTATDTNGTAVQSSFRLEMLPPPEIAVEQPAGSDVADGGSRTFPVVNVGASADLVFTIKNTASGPLTLEGTPKVAVDGADAGMFTVIAQPASPVAASGGSTTFTVRFAPTGGGAKSAALHIANNDSDEVPFDIALTGTANALPVLTLPASPLLAEATSGGGAAVAFNVTANDAEDGALTPTVAPASGGTFPIGDTTVNVSATDSRGAQRTGSFTVRVRDTTAPALTLPANVSVEPASAAGTAVSYPLATATDAVGVTSLTVSKASGTVFPLGITTVTVTAADAANHTTTATFTVTVAFSRPAATTVIARARTGILATAPGGAILSTFGPPAMNDFRHLATRVSMFANGAPLGGIYLEDEAGNGSVAAFQGGAAPGISGAAFKSFLDPVLALDGSVAFVGKVKGGVEKSADSGVWTNAFGSALELVLREGSAVPGLPVGATLKAISGISLRNGELLALLTLNVAPGVVKEKNDTALVRLTGAGAGTVLLREGRELAGLPGTKVQTFSVLSPALGSPGHGRWHAEGLVVAKATLFDGRTLLVKIAPDGIATPLLSTADAATPVAAEARWKAFGLPAVCESGADFAVAATLKPERGGVVAANKNALLFSSGGAAWGVFARQGDPAPVTPAGPLYASFFDPLVNDAGDVAFLATLQGTGIAKANQTAIFAGLPDDPQLIARLGNRAPDELGAASSAVWTKFISFALPGGPDAGVIFLAKTSAGEVGLWAVDSQGTLRRVLRTGDIFPDVSLQGITALTLLKATAGAYGVARSYSATGSIALVATFADTTQALLRVDLP